MIQRVFFIALLLAAQIAYADDSLTIRRMSDQIMLQGECYTDLKDLCKNIGHRLSGSPQAEKAVVWAQKALTDAGADRVWLQPVNVPHWVRGKESLKVKTGNGKAYQQIPMLSLGNSHGTDGYLLEAQMILANSFEEFEQLQEEDIKGKIVFFNFPFPQHVVNTFEGYGIAGPYRWHGPNRASAKGAKAVIIRSVSTGIDDVPHTGSMRYADSVKHIPAIAIGNKSADMLAAALRKGEMVTAQLQSECRMMGTAKSYNVIGEIKGETYPDQIVLVGGHLDSWDVGDGAHDDGAGCVQSIEVIRTFKKLGIRPKRTIRAVLFMNEENGLAGGYTYADSARSKGENHILAIESDAGGFSPRGFGLKMSPERKEQILQFKHLFLPYGIYDFSHDEGGADIYPLNKQGTPAAGLVPDPQRYFDLHHTASDVFEAVNHRELKLGAVALTSMVYLVSKYGLR